MNSAVTGQRRREARGPCHHFHSAVRASRTGRDAGIRGLLHTRHARFSHACTLALHALSHTPPSHTHTCPRAHPPYTHLPHTCVCTLHTHLSPPLPSPERGCPQLSIKMPGLAWGMPCACALDRMGPPPPRQLRACADTWRHIPSPAAEGAGCCEGLRGGTGTGAEPPP